MGGRRAQQALVLPRTHRISWMISGWIGPVELGPDGGGTASLTIGCPDEFFAVRLGFANTTATAWIISKAIGCASSSFNDYVNPTGKGSWTPFTFVNKGADDDRLVTRPTNQVAINVSENTIDLSTGRTSNPAWTWTDWTPIRSVDPDPATQMRVLMLRALIPSGQTVCFANSQLRKLTGNAELNNNFDYFTGGIKFNFDKVTDPSSSSNDATRTWLDNQLASGSLFPIVQFLTKNAGIVGATTGDSHHQGTSTTEQMTNYLYRATTQLGNNYIGEIPFGMVNCAMGGLTSDEFFPRLLALLPAVRPSYVVLPGWSYNDRTGVAHADQSAIDLFSARLIQTVECCQQCGIVPILLTPLPRDAEAMTPGCLEPWRDLRQTILNLRRAGVIVIDGLPLLGAVDDGEYNGVYLSPMSDDGAHPNNSGHAAIAGELMSVLQAAMNSADASST
jgi:hypothetical protein